MQPLFMAFGPGFAKNSTIKKISSMDVYPLMCSVLEIEPLGNNGSIANLTSILTKAYVKNVTGERFLFAV
jgi:ectonucleotide pyrophosphatase/phosphodiesterase family protein 5